MCLWLCLVIFLNLTAYLNCTWKNTQFEKKKNSKIEVREREISSIKNQWFFRGFLVMVVKQSAPRSVLNIFYSEFLKTKTISEFFLKNHPISKKQRPKLHSVWERYRWFKIYDFFGVMVVPNQLDLDKIKAKLGKWMVNFD